MKHEPNFRTNPCLISDVCFVSPDWSVFGRKAFFFKHARENKGFFSNQTAPANERRLTTLSLLSLTCTSVGPNLWCKWRCHCWFRGGGGEEEERAVAGSRVEEGG
jgi:hypothetical protein